ncbi:MAG: TIGR02757 family protein [Campylobacter sputorum]|uniref:TIGR02757 family protein n=1 Tax=Campylobacter sputorum TaxID=206 RepID=UPI0019148E96|nr:TIGR02757 family protein [Campylobacter sputorum]ASM38610.1 DUF2400 domain protein [Campylobacter sputorum bv. paraureolyticus LMG 11764]MDY6120836.1 TIGR02757 family protein [Campylobacter sputorum]
MIDLKNLLDFHANLKNCDENLLAFADPLQVARKYKEPNIALICALFAYGNAKMIVKFLNSLNFDLLDESDEEISKFYTSHKYRFQSIIDVKEIFITHKRLKQDGNIEEIVTNGMKKSGEIIDGLNELMKFIYSLNDYRSFGYNFYFGSVFQTPISPYKRYNMFLRWMIRSSDIDLGLFKSIDKRYLLIPLDTHTHKVALKLGLISRKSYDFKAVMELTQKLRQFDKNDPIKYDFALYRLGQSKEIDSILKQ